jgi:hypothetical protein
LAVLAHRVISTLIVNNQQRFAMTGHQPGSHKKKKKSRQEDTDEKRVEKRRRLSRTPEAVATPPVVTQTQDSLLVDAPCTPIPAVVTATVAPTTDGMHGSPLADNLAIATGANETGLSLFAEVAIERLELFKDKTSKQKAVKLTSVSVFAFLRKGFVPALIDDLSMSRRLRASSSASVKRAVNGFDTAVYTRHVKTVPGKSRRIAANEKKRASALVTPDSKHEVDIPTFDIQRANQLVPQVNWDTLSPSFSLDSRKLRRYIVEDLMFADPSRHDRLLILVSTRHNSFLTTWLPIFLAQASSRTPVSFDEVMFFQIEAEVVKNAKRMDYVDGMVNEEEVKYQLTFEGGAGVCLHFPNCERRFDIELKFATVFYEPQTFQVWGTRKIAREFHKRLQKLSNEPNREALYSRYLTELYGDTAQTMYLSVNYKTFENNSGKPSTPFPVTPVVTDWNDTFKCLHLDVDVYTSFIQHVDGVFRQAVTDCYGRFVCLTEPIVPQSTMVRIAQLFKDKFKPQYWAIATQLNYCTHMKRFRTKHLLPFYDRMILYHFISMCRVRCHRTFTWWALVNTCMRYGSMVNSASAGLDSVFFGHALVPFSVMRKTKEYRQIDENYFKRISEPNTDIENLPAAASFRSVTYLRIFAASSIRIIFLIIIGSGFLLLLMPNKRRFEPG